MKQQFIDRIDALPDVLCLQVLCSLNTYKRLASRMSIILWWDWLAVMKFSERLKYDKFMDKYLTWLETRKP